MFKLSNPLLEIFDVLFIMILCFGTLLTTMLMQGSVLVGGSASGIHYDFKVSTLLAVAAGLVAYLSYLIPRSDKELRAIIANMYEKQNDTPGT